MGCTLAEVGKVPEIITVYELTSPSGKKYVGQTKLAIEERLKQHLKSKNCSAVSAAIRKYGRKSFQVKELARCVSRDQANALEQYFIAVLGTLRPHGYNITAGGSQQSFTEETRRRMSDAGKKRASDPQIRAKLSSYLVGSRGHLKGKPAHNRKPVVCITTGQRFSSVAEASKVLGIDYSSISAVCNGRRGMKQTGGFKFSWM
jgi:group I intron endonuclease